MMTGTYSPYFERDQYLGSCVITLNFTMVDDGGCL